MTWSGVLRAELLRLRAQEDLATAAFEAMAEQASGEATQTILRELVDAAPSRLGRLELVLAHAGGPLGGVPLRSFEGWREDVRALAEDGERGETHDAGVLSLLLRCLRSRTACYEVAFVVARSLRADATAGMLGVLLASDRETDGRVAEALARIIEEGEGRWDLRDLDDLKA